MIKRMKPISMPAGSNLTAQLGNQTIDRSIPKSHDPKNFPVFSIPLGGKVLVYVPNHTVVDADGNQILRADRPILHAINDGRSFRYIRCVHGLVEDSIGYDGDCPLCDGVSEPWDLANAKIRSRCAQLGLDPEDRENKDVKSIRSSEFSDRVLKEGERYLTFPIVVFETDADCKKLVTDDKKNIKYQIFWYSISEKLYDKTWAKTIEEMEDEPTSPAGQFFVLSYVYDTKGRPANARDSARALAVHHKPAYNTKEAFNKLKVQLDKATEDWTPEKAAEVVINNNLFSMEDLQALTDDVLRTTRETLALYNSAEEVAPAGTSSAPALKLGDKVDTPEPTPLLSAGETDADDDDVGGEDFAIV
jgi:hypothetical protein